mgnify:CR=1 FL=1
MHRQRGFTIIEMMVTIFVIGILAAIALPALQTLTANRHADRLSQELQIDIMYARNQAMTFQQTVTITPINNDWVNGWQINQGTDLLRENNPNAKSGEITSQAGSIEFNGRGLLSSVAAQIEISVANCTGNRKRTISVNLLGQLVTQAASC